MIGANRVTVWTIALAEVPGVLWPLLAGLLDPAERARAAAFHFERDRRQHIAAHALKRLMLTAASARAVLPEHWVFETGAHGKPRIARGAGPHFNISHCDGLVACAVSHRVEVGLDVEPLHRPPSLDGTDVHFAASERAWLRGVPQALRSIGFLQLWTLKEAYLKATGRGFSQRLDAFAFTFEPLRISFLDPALGEAADWRFEQKVIGPHILAVACRDRATAFPIEIEAAPLQDLLRLAAGHPPSYAASTSTPVSL